MNPQRVRASCYRSFDALDIDLPEGCVAIVGANGAGKSSIVSLVDLALFGAESRSLADYVTDGLDGPLEVELLFEHAAEQYRVRRSFKKGKATLDFEESEWHDAGEHIEWRPLTRESARETQELIEHTIGLTRETFRASAYLAQGDGAAFTEAAPRDRKRILGEILGLSVYDRLQECAKQDHRAADRELAEIEGETRAAHEVAAGKQDVERTLATARETHIAATKELAVTEASLADIEKACDGARADAAERVAAESALAAARADLHRIVETFDARERLTVQIRTDETVVAQLPAVADVEALEERAERQAALVVEHREKQAARARAISDREAWERQQASIARRVEAHETLARAAAAKLGEIHDDHAAACDRCGRSLDDDTAKAAAVASLIAEATENQQAVAKLRGEAVALLEPAVADEPEPLLLEDLGDQVRRARAGASERVRVEERIRNAKQMLAAVPADLDEQHKQALAVVTAAAQALEKIAAVDVAALERARDAARRSVGEQRDRLQQAQLAKTRAEDRLEQIHGAEHKLQLAAGRQAELHAELDVVVALERAFGRDGIPSLIVENSAIPFLESEASRILGELGTGYQVELRTQAALKSGDGVKDTLDVIVVAENGERAYETFSGGERTRINLALRIALARLLAARRGAESRLLAIDEPEFLDEAGTAALVEVLRGLTEFTRVYLISHVPALRDSFDQVLTVVKDGTRSRVEGARDEVLA